ncbi:MAG: calcium-translocating P-type ATPase, PMCA-type [Phascolarctobacterium sp.]|nr:calcium-translocating P-type ATPase, PMCA-type [Phascolarctobacterium sp.]
MKNYGLTSNEVQESLKKYGNNALPQPPRETFWDKLLENFRDPIIRILVLALLVNVVFVYMGHGEWIETAGIFVAIILATFVSTYSEYSNENAFQKLQEEASRIRCKVWRDGDPVKVHIEDIVVGDAVILESGDKIPVDGILLEGDLKLDQAVLNGESEEATKKIAPADFVWNDEKIDFLDECKLFRGSVVVEGTGIMQAIKIGSASIYGQLTQELKDDERDSPLKLKLRGLAENISRFGYIGGALIAVAVMIHKMVLAGGFEAYVADPAIVFGDLMQAIILAIIIIVMAVPEGLPLMIAIVSSLNMTKMLKDNVLVRKLVGIETAGSLNILFTDKTGTITKGKLEIVRFITGDRTEYTIFSELAEKHKRITYHNAILNTSASFAGGRIIGGNMTEAALSRYIGEYREEDIPARLDFMPFNSANKYSWAIVDDGNKKYFLIKGAPEKLLLQTSYYWDTKGQREPLTEDMKAGLEKIMFDQAEKAIRMLALCTCSEGIEEGVLPDNGLTLVGILCIRDEVRPEATEAIKAVQDAGVQVVMITGDRKETAVAIAKDSGLLRSPDDIVWTSAEIADMSDEEIKKRLPKLRVVARALPSDKTRLVRLSQEINLVVGMTGDGVNDSPALKKADVGFAMGNGTEVAKEAGDIVILDDNFLSIKKAILYGRTIYNSICKFIVFQLTINFSAVAINFIAPFIDIDRPLTIMQILWVNLVMDTLAALAFGGEPALEEYLKERPKNRGAAILSRKMLTSVCLGGIYMTAIGIAFYKSPWIDHFFRNAPNHIYTYTAFFCVYIFMAVANGFNVRANGMNLLKNIGLNKGFLEIMALIVVIQVALTYVGGSILRTAPLNLREWGIVVFFTLSFVVFNILCKWLQQLIGVKYER